MQNTSRIPAMYTKDYDTCVRLVHFINASMERLPEPETDLTVGDINAMREFRKALQKAQHAMSEAVRHHLHHRHPETNL